MVLGASARAGVVAVAVGDALSAPFLADVVGQGLGVFGDVGADAVVADAAVGEGVGGAVVGGDGGGVGCGLEADEGALGLLLFTPEFYGCELDVVGETIG